LSNAQEHIDKKVYILITKGRFYFYRRSTGIVSLTLGRLYLSKEKVFYQKSLVTEYKGDIDVLRYSSIFTFRDLNCSMGAVK
jgi:hypothetical protein